MACISLDIRWVRVNCMSECDTVQHVSAGGRRAAVDVGNDRRVWHGRWYWHHCRGELTCYCRQAHRRRRLSCAHWLLIVYRITICLLRVLTIVDSLHFAWVIDNAKCTMVTRICVSVCLSVCLSVAACLHYCTDPDVTWQSGRGCPLVVHCWADLQSVHGLRCCGNTMEMRGRAPR